VRLAPEPAPAASALPMPPVSAVPARSILLKPVWDAVPGPAQASLTVQSGRAVVVGGEADLQRVRAMFPDAERLRVDGTDTIETIAATLAAGQEPLGHLIWLAPRQTPALTDDAVIAAQEGGLYACFRALKAVLSLGYGRRPLAVTAVTENAVPVLRHDQVDPTHAGLHGLLGSVAQEYPGWQVRLADLDRDHDWPLAEVFSLPYQERGALWAYRRRRWYRQRLIPVQGLGASGSRPSYRQGGTYVVIGGGGGIGEAWTEHVIRAYGAQVVWIGRREQDTTIREKRRRLGALGPEPLYVRADATSRDSLTAAYHQIKCEHPVIHGVIHSAIVLDDQSLARMDEERFRAAVAAKVDVSVRLAQVFGGEPLDFVLFFSSMNSFLKAPGQSNYVAGSVFKDAYAHRLDKEISADVKVMNWGYWGSVGIVASEQYRERMSRAGAASIEPADGMAALDVLIGGAFHQLGLVKAQAEAA
jgi:short-subunit dehydrogenase